MVAERVQGKVKWFDGSKGYGYITPEHGEDLFVHYSEINDGGLKNLTAGEQVEFSVVEDPRGPLAVEVTRL
jgi:CspA family cold shock protein